MELVGPFQGSSTVLKLYKLLINSDLPRWIAPVRTYTRLSPPILDPDSPATLGAVGMERISASSIGGGRRVTSTVMQAHNKVTWERGRCPPTSPGRSATAPLPSSHSRLTAAATRGKRPSGRGVGPRDGVADGGWSGE